MGSGWSKGPASFATPKLPTGGVVICRQYSVPAEFMDAWEGIIQMLGFPDMWSVDNGDPGASVEDTLKAANEFINGEWPMGCHPVGEIIELATSTVPGWALPCDGGEYLQDDYPELMAVINPVFITDGTHFRTPDRVNRIGLHGPVVGVLGGENTHTLTVTEIPSHNHDQIDHVHSTTIPFGEGLALAPGELPVVIGQAPAATGLAQSVMLNTGGGGSHNNMQAYEGTVFALVAKSSG